MDEQKIQQFLVANRGYFKASQMEAIAANLREVSDGKSAIIKSLKFKSPTTVLLVSVFLGQIGIDRFMIGNTLMGIVKLLTSGGLGFIWLWDICTIRGKVKELNYQQILTIL